MGGVTRAGETTRTTNGTLADAHREEMMRRNFPRGELSTTLGEVLGEVRHRGDRAVCGDGEELRSIGSFSGCEKTKKWWQRARSGRWTILWNFWRSDDCEHAVVVGWKGRLGSELAAEPKNI